MFGKKRSHVEKCTSCERGIREGQKVCECGKATSFMTFDERREYEVTLWRGYGKNDAVPAAR